MERIEMSEDLIDECLYELLKGFTLYKLQQIKTLQLFTNESGNEITVCLCKFGAFTDQKVAYIIESFS